MTHQLSKSRLPPEGSRFLFVSHDLFFLEIDVPAEMFGIMDREFELGRDTGAADICERG